MILIIGGFASGKRNYVKEKLGYSEEDISETMLNDKPVLTNLHDLIRKDADYNSDNYLDNLVKELCTKEVITCNEVGCGVVPLNKEECNYRETVGRTCIELAKHAEKVIRIFCGIPTVIKGD